MNKIFFILGLILFFSCDDIGKNYKWQDNISSGFSRVYGTKGYDYGWNAEYSHIDGGIIVVGRQQRTINGQTDLWAIKTDSKGLVEWQKIFGGNSNDEGFDVIATSDGGFLFVGYSWSYGNEQQVFAVKTDFYGNSEWEKTFGGSMWEVAEAVIELKSGGFLIAGYSNSPGISSGNTDFYLIKLDIAGNLLWQKGYGNLEYPNHEWAYDITELPDEGFLVVGGRDRYEKGSKNALVLRTDKDGDFLWEKEFSTGDNINELIFSINSTQNGNYYLCSTLNSVLASNTYKPKITKIDVEGNIDWSRTFNANANDYHRFKSTKTMNGDIVLVGTSIRKVLRGNDEDAFMTRIDAQGNIIWSFSYGTYDNNDWGWSAFENRSNDLIFVGSTKSFGASLFDIYLVGANSEGISQ